MYYFYSVPVHYFPLTNWEMEEFLKLFCYLKIAPPPFFTFDHLLVKLCSRSESGRWISANIMYL